MARPRGESGRVGDGVGDGAEEEEEEEGSLELECVIVQYPVVWSDYSTVVQYYTVPDIQ